MNIKRTKFLKMLINTPGINRIAPRWTERVSQRLAFQVALNLTYITSAHRYYPKWRSYFMDEKFRTHGADVLSADYLNEFTRPEPVELANVWAEQMQWLDHETEQEYIAELVPIASRFLHYLEAELRTHPEFQIGLYGGSPLFDREMTVGTI